ncbi:MULTISPECIES: hypothetical protein [Rhodococcus]|nr:hypothetical protein [Rhodococcus rhodochrous]MCR8693422.1 hypothetical protein [Rhodococcus pyridinivorans]MCD2097609.1 hypothetical protein [Rhodococcus rhodochrous]MCD2122831.1 hypothetical protein [Rhodococcus rhodochrous]MCQ4133720.1 hypothetical protein [Rhodococcus rhodochrous]MDJ0018225.1 hypothetical protein [Rhodococcus rhodochrous]
MTMTALVDERREQFKKDVAALGLDAPRSDSGGRARLVGLALMVIGAVAVFVVYIASLTLSDTRDLLSYQLLALGFVAVTLVGVAVYLAAAVTRVLRLWLVRQLLESSTQAERIAQALARND